MYTPSSTYRIQFNNQFTFRNLAGQLQYLNNLGIGAIYASPVFAAVPGSNHGYDVTNPLVFNSEVGTEDDFELISSFLKAKNIGWVQDIVPNHMAFHPQNEWLMDVLDKGKLSAYAGYFDIDWEHPDFMGKVMVPILGKHLDQAITDREIKLIWQEGGLFITYYDFKIPASGESFHELLEEYKALEGSYYVGQGIANDEYKSDPAFRGFGWSNSRERFQAIYQTDNSFETLIDNICEEVNNDSQKLHDLLARQNFVLTHWQEVETHLNYRRFFTINGLISLSMEKQQVFDTYHTFIHEKVKTGKFTGLRIDHVDGLKCPAQYFDRLRALMEEETFIVVEKILESHEELEKDWPLQGSSGYDFLAIVNNLFTNKTGYKRLTDFYSEISGNKLTPDEVIYQKKKLILTESFSGDWVNLSRMIEKSGLITYNDKVTPSDLHNALGEFLVNFPVYKLYSDCLPLQPDDAEKVRDIIETSIRKNPLLTDAFTKLKDLFLTDYQDKQQRKAAREIFLRCMQYTGPLMAKGVEDTAMYTWPAFIAHNEVGDAIDAKGISIDVFHEKMIDRWNHYPMSINATATHDTKRGEDSRARLNVISNFYPEWEQLVKICINNSLSLKTSVNGTPAPDIDEEYFIYQTLIGAFPMDGLIDPSLSERLTLYLQKALREAKVHSNWNRPNEEYEKAVTGFAKNLLTRDYNFKAQLNTFIDTITPWGIINSLSQVVLKCTCPGIPDFYQGTELWDLSLVDPDNRRSVDYKKRETLLTELKALQQSDKTFFQKLLKNKANGKLKLWITHTLMQERARHPREFIDAEYLPLTVTGEFKDNILAFARTTTNHWYLTIVPLHQAKLPRMADNSRTNWKDTTITLPANAPSEWKLLWDNFTLSSGSEITLADALLYDCPMVFKGKDASTGRASGLLLHITSLPGKYGTGDLGSEAYKFVDSLRKANQKYWQILPFNPVGSSFSPYSSSSAFAGNTTFIDPEELHRQRLIAQIPVAFGESSSADFTKAEALREQVLDEAFNSYVNHTSPLFQKRFENFCERESAWLNDFALFSIFKNEFDKKSWDQWPENIKFRDRKTLAVYEEKYAVYLTRIKFGQFIFSQQMKKLKAYANARGVKIIGDLPIYVSYDSADVWANPALFNLDSNLKMITVAGVPPDYFSKTGQLWNMPVYNWQKMSSNSYTWWKQRIHKNLEYADMIRFDHFRGFSSYWEVPATETTAINGKWTEGPAHGFFTELKREFPDMPFIAEDLGDIDEKVYKLRDAFALPGMKVLQFAFGDNMPHSVHIPHMHTRNSVVYTGTHDNNTIKGWYKNELAKENATRMKEYLNRKVDPTTITDEMIRMALSSVARIAIIPAQDLLSLGESARFNSPSTPTGNWTWKLKPDDIKLDDWQKLKKLTLLYGR